MYSSPHNEVRFAHLADLHFGAEDQYALAAAKEAIIAENVAGLIVAGDLTQRGSASEFEAASAWLNSFDLPVISIPGNHDTPLLNMLHRVTSPFQRYEDHTGDFLPVGDIAGVHFYGINTARGWQARRNWAEGSVNLSHLEAAIQSAEESSSEHAVLVCHHPFLEPDRTPLRVATRRGQRASRLLAESPFALALYGHVHVPTAAPVCHGDNTYIAATAGTLSTRLRKEPAGFNFLTFHDDTFQLEAIKITRDAVDRTVLGRFPTAVQRVDCVDD